MEGSVARLAGVGGRESRRQAYKDVFTQHLNSIAHWLWLTILDNLGAGFTASCQASYRTLNKAHSSRRLFIRKSLVNADFMSSL
jgi:hypothetical protein